MTAAHPTRTAVPPEHEMCAKCGGSLDSDRHRHCALNRTAVPAAEDALVERIRALADCSYWANVEWIIPGDATQKIGRLAVEAADRIESLRARVAELEGVIAEHNKRCAKACEDCADAKIGRCRKCPLDYMIEVPK